MIRSMTGFCKSSATLKDITCNIEIKTVNHRFLDARIVLPKPFAHLEEPLKKRVRQQIQRGKVDIHLQLESPTERSERLVVDTVVWDNLMEIVRALELRLDRPIQFSVSDLTGIRNLLRYEQPELLTAAESETLFQLALEKGLDELIGMKQREGEILVGDLQGHIAEMQRLIADLPSHLDEAQERQQQKLRKNLSVMGLDDRSQDPRVLQEIGILLDRCDITEEIERFRAHLLQLTELLDSETAVGRKLDFILQELNREANTLCSKSIHLPITQIGVSLKSEIEKVREQIQNIE
jgi:uncharacterized protein (TIGR00255 family)